MEFSVEYDKRSLASAVKSLFRDRWYPVFPGTFVSLTIVSLVVGMISLILSGFVLTTAIFLLLGVLSPCALFCAFVLHRRRLMKLLGTAARIDFDERFIRVDSAFGKVELPWRSINRIDRDEENILLFVSRGAAIIVPAESTSPDALDFLEQKRRSLVSS